MTRLLTFLGIAAISTVALAESMILYTLELGGNNQSQRWESGEVPAPPFLLGDTTQDHVFVQGMDITWGVRVTVGGWHVLERPQDASEDDYYPGLGYPGGTDGGIGHPLGAAHLLFDIALYEADGETPVELGAAVLQCDVGQPGDPSAIGCEPVTAGFWSSANDGDSNGRGGVDPLANAALARAIIGDQGTQNHYVPEPAGPFYTLADSAPNGPHFDFGFYPSANGRAGIRLGTNSTPQTLNRPDLNGRLVGFSIGYLGYDYTSYRPGVGMDYFSTRTDQHGFGAFVDPAETAEPSKDDPLDIKNYPTIRERPLFEGQISTIGLAPGTYILKVIPSPSGNNILHGDVAWDSLTPEFGGFMTFATRANCVAARPLLPNSEHGLRFQIRPRFSSYVFYNNSSFYDLGSCPSSYEPSLPPGCAIDSTKSPLVEDGSPTMASFANWTGCDKGINGLVFEIVDPSREPEVTDYQFWNIGRDGNSMPPLSVTPSSFVVTQPLPQLRRVVVTFQDGLVKKTWLKVEVGTGFGLPAPTVLYWGNAVGDTGLGNPNAWVLVSSTDSVAVRNAFGSQSPEDHQKFDLDRDGDIDGADETIVINNITHPGNCVTKISR